MKSNVKRIVSMILLIVMAVLCMPNMVLAVETDISGKVETEFVVTSQWQGGFNAEMKIKNVSDSVIDNWQITFDFPQEITNIWNANISSHNGENYIIKNAGWNSDISVDSEVSFGFSGTWGNEITEPYNIKLISDVAELNDDSINYDFQLFSDWGSGFSGQITITNNTEQDIEDWSLEFDFEKNIDSIWNAVIESVENGHYCVKNAGYNEIIYAGQSVSFGFNGSSGNVTNEPCNYRLAAVNLGDVTDEIEPTVSPTEIPIPTEQPTDGVTDIGIDVNQFANYNEEMNMGTVNEKIECIYGTLNNYDEVSELTYSINDLDGNVLTQGNLDVQENWQIDDVVLGIGISLLNVTATDDDGEITEKEFYILNSSVENTNIDKAEFETDNDEDGLVNYAEDYFNTDKDNPDTDGDGLPDGYEIYMSQTNPLLLDSDSNGISDADEDFDSDFLLNYDEYIAETSPRSADTDADEINDYDELYLYETNPIIADTDGDGLADNIDLKLGFDPLLYDTNGNGIADSKEYTYQTLKYDIDCSNLPDVNCVTVQGAVEGDINNTISVYNMYEMNIISTQIEALVGAPIEIDVDCEFEELEMIFDCNSEIDLNQLGILQYDKEKNRYDVINSSINKDNNTISAIINNDGEFMVVDLSLWSEDWNDYIWSEYPVFTDEELEDAKKVQEVRMQTVSEEIVNEEKREITKVDVSFESSNDIECTTTIEDMYGIDTYSSDLVGLIGVPVNIETDSEFDEATVVFTYDKNELGETDEDDLGILWYDVENGCYEKMDSVVDKENCTITFKTTHFSEYMAYDKEQYDKLFEENSEADHGNDIWQGKIITPEEFRKMLMKYRYSYSISDITAMADGRPLYIALIETNYNFPEELGTLKQEVYCVANELLGGMKVAKVRYYDDFGTIGLENTDMFLVLESEGTYKFSVGRPYKCPYFDDIDSENPGTVEMLEKYYIPAYYFDSTDSDEDGLLDVYEAQGMRLTNGRILYTDMDIADMDKDGIRDGGEVYRCDVKDGFFYVRSNPNAVDSDGDGYDDDIDPEPMYVNDFEEDVEITDWCYDRTNRECRINFSVFTMPASIWADVKVKIEFDNPKLPLFINNTTSNVIELGNIYGNEGINAEWEFKLSNETLFKNVGYTITLTANGQDFYTTHRYMTEEEYNTAKVSVKKGTMNADNSYPISVKVTGETNHTVSGVIKDGDGNIVKTYKSKNIKDAQDCVFCAVLDGNKKYSVEVVVNKGMANEYRYMDGVSVGNKYVDTDGDSYYDFEDRYPYVRAKYSSYFKKVNSYNNFTPPLWGLVSQRKESENNYNKYNFEIEYLNDIYRKAFLYSFVPEYINMECGKALGNYLKNTGDSMCLDVESIITDSRSGKENYQYNLGMLKNHIESVLKDGETVVVGNINTLRVHNFIYMMDFDWNGTLGACESGGMVAEVSKNSNIYNIKLKYYVNDFYDWKLEFDVEFVPDLSNGELACLHLGGISKQFYQYGIYETNMHWDEVKK